MKALMQWIFDTWQMYWGDGFYQYLLLAAAAYLLLFHRKKESTRQVLAFSFVLLLIFLCPFTAKIIRACIGQSVYWRVLWLLPAIPVIALAATEFLRGRKSGPLRAVLLLLCCVLIALSGRDMLSAGNYVRTVNRQKVPDDVAHVCNMVLAEAAKDGISEIYMASDDYLCSYVRVCEPSIRQPYGRRGMGSLTQPNARLYRLMQEEEPRNYKRIAKLCQKIGCNFLVIAVPEEKTSHIEKYGYAKIGDVGSYSVYQLEASGADAD